MSLEFGDKANQYYKELQGQTHLKPCSKMLNDSHIQLLLIVFLLISTLNFTHSVLSNINDSDSNEVEISYRGNSRSERSLPICELNVACNIVHKRFWFPIKVERLCRCHNTFQCSQQWSQIPDNYTMMLSNRSQLKFCNNISELQKCTTDEPAIQLQSVTATIPRGRSKKPLVQTKAVVKCNCPMGRYWKRINAEADNETSTTVYQCADAKKCETNEICGYARADMYSIYYQCSCPAGNLCLFVDYNTYNVTELFYSGAAYQALCTPFPDNL
ncbi:U-scoloptoxin(11)-Sm2a-like [Schistocerca gregaria]|uniref:U-scoloptoxin(11)-Sm2a-like n=1 Tax=Schistocerca gregaria TaxID=7010 RepID=UPI00211EE863|nr:U-scoloptoxin(11)-Sm2a-like [Schistocerca gregaria]